MAKQWANIATQFINITLGAIILILNTALFSAIGYHKLLRQKKEYAVCENKCFFLIVGAARAATPLLIFNFG